jgi:anti-sigma regulatory factor (Ser/Thr protein kinase)
MTPAQPSIRAAHRVSSRWNSSRTRRGRQLVVKALQQWLLEPLVDSAALLSTEVITNAVLHARTRVTVSFERFGDDGVQISVSDGSTFVPQRRQAKPDSTNGRGLDPARSTVDLVVGHHHLARQDGAVHAGRRA